MDGQSTFAETYSDSVVYLDEIFYSLAGEEFYGLNIVAIDRRLLYGNKEDYVLVIVLHDPELGVYWGAKIPTDILGGLDYSSERGPLIAEYFNIVEPVEMQRTVTVFQCEDGRLIDDEITSPF